MKCPKCNYIGFEATDRCRNCGYEFSLAGETPAAADLPIQASDDPGPLTDFPIRDEPHAGGRRTPSRALDLDRVIGAPETPSTGVTPAPDLPLFSGAATPARTAASTPPDGPALERTATVTPAPPHPSTPHRPMGVRRPAADPVRPRLRPPRVQTATLDLPLPPVEPMGDEGLDEMRPPSPALAIIGPASLGARAAAGTIDLVLLGGIDLATLLLTLRLVELPPAEWHALPMLPLAAFFLVLNGGYLALFTAASGQTIGKMAIGLKVVSDDEGPVPLRDASVRALGALASTVCLGAGLWPAVADDEGRALYDRLAQTRVVRVDA